MDEPPQVGSTDDDAKSGDEGHVPSTTNDAKTIISIAERRAAKCGFKAERISKCSTPCVTIPPGISPTALLDSPVMLPNSQLSPTTGTFSLPPLNQESSLPNINQNGSNAGSLFGFNAHGVPDSLPDFSSSGDQKGDVDYQALFTVDLPIDFEFSSEFPKENNTKSHTIDLVSDGKVSDGIIKNDSCGNVQLHCSDRDSDLTSLQKETIHGEDIEMHDLPEGDQKGTNPVASTSEDVYNWRKYGQKQVKGSEYPRSYYKCTHPDCQVKKKVERSYDGQITKIIYKGAHNHPKPQPSRRPLLGSAFSSNEMSEKSEGSETCVKVEDGMVWRSTEAGLKDIKLGSDWQADGLERTSSTSVVTELSDPLSPIHGKSVGALESSETPELSSTVASHDDNDDGGNLGSIALGDEANGDESQSKRRKMDNSLLETNLPSSAVREPRVVVQIESEVDILDDGYRWRKYGQKVVKGNPNPRSYYKCTSAGCLVRKHVERASHNIKCVITTYEGKHNHEVPAARNSSHVNSSGGNFLPASADAQPVLILPRNTYTSKPGPQIQDIAPHFERKPELNNEYMRPSFLQNFNNEMKFGTPSVYLMKFPPLQNSCNTFGENPNRNVPPGSAVPDFPISLPWTLPTSANLSLAGIERNNSNRKPIVPNQSFLTGQQLNENDRRFLKPKQEKKDEDLHDACVSIVDHANVSSSSSSLPAYLQVMRNFPS